MNKKKKYFKQKINQQYDYVLFELKYPDLDKKNEVDIE